MSCDSSLSIDVDDKAVLNFGKMILMSAFLEDLHCEAASCVIKRKMFKILVLLVLCLHALSQPVTNEPSSRLARQAAECCPCPGSSNGGQDMLVGTGQLARADDLDDCPCWPRGADSEGASSILFPSTVKDGPILRQNDLKEDPKNLLEPEITLARSMLDTLHRATEEEYQDALARDAAKSAAEPDALSEESARNVVIIVNPKESDDQDDIISEASQVEESRCIQPLESTLLGKIRKPLKSNNVLSLSDLKHPNFAKRKLLHTASDLDASNVQESTTDISNTPKFKSQIPTLNLRNTFKSISDDKADRFQPLTSLSRMGGKESSFSKGLKLPLVSKLKLQNSMFSVNDLTPASSNIQEQLEVTDELPTFQSKTPELRLSNKSMVDDDDTSFHPTSSSKLKSQNKMLSSKDLTSTSSHMQDQSEVTDDKTNQLLRHSKLPLNWSQLLKLRNVELVPNRIRNKHSSKSKLDKSKFAIPTLRKGNENEKNFEDNCENVKYDRTSENIGDQHKTKNNALQKVIRPFNNIKENSSSKLDEVLSDDDECKFIKANLENLDTDPSQVRSPIVANQKERIVDLASQNTIENINEYNFPEFKELANSPKNHVKENQIISYSDKPNIITYLVQETGNTNDDQDSVINDALEIQSLNTNKDLDTESSNNAPNLAHLNLLEKHVTDLLPQYQENNIGDVEAFSDRGFNNYYDTDKEIRTINLSNPLDNIEMVPQLKTIPPLSDTLKNLQENVIRRYENFKIPSVNSDSTRMFPNSDNLSVPNEINGNIDNNSQNNRHSDNINEITTDLHYMDAIKSNIKETMNDISMKDLQDMSDKLFASNSKKQSNKMSLKVSECDTKSKEAKFESNEFNYETDNKSSETNLDPVNAEERFSNGDKNDKYMKEKTCPTIIENINTPGNQEQSLKSAAQEAELNEMDTGASDSILKTLPSSLDAFNFNSKLNSPLLENIALQVSEDPLSLLRKPLTSLDVLNLNTNLPTLGDLQERLTNIFNTNDRSAEDDSSSFESDCTNDYSRETMASEASRSNPQIKLPSLKQLKDLNVDIFRSRPITSSTTETLSPRLHLNSYLTKAPVPRKLKFKPVKMESRLVPTRKFKPSNSELRLESFPTLEDLRKNVRLNSKNLLSSSSRPDLNLFTDNLHSNDIGDIADTFRLNTQNTMKTLRQKMKSALRKTKINNHLGDSFAKPQELLDDVNDKLKGIHYDLNDRLSSIHENIMDSPQIKTLVNQPRKLGNRNDFTNIMTNIRQTKAKPPPLRLQKAASTVTSQIMNPHNSKQRDFTLNTEPRRFINTDWDKLHNIPTTAESSPIRNDMPKSASISNLQKSIPLWENPTMAKAYIERKPLSAFIREPTNFKDENRPILRTSVSPFKKQPKKVTVSFETTTTRPVISPRQFHTPRVPTMTSPQFDEYRQNIFSRTDDKSASEIDLVGDTLKPAEDIAVLPTIFKSLRSSASEPSSYHEKVDKFSLKKYPMRSLDLRSSVLKKMPDSKTHGNLNKIRLSNIFDDSTEKTISDSRVKPLIWPKVNENVFTSKVRDSNNLRLSNREPKSNGNVKTEYAVSDMLKSPSENTDIVIDAPLQENVSYKCSMVCTKVIN